MSSFSSRFVRNRCSISLYCSVIIYNLFFIKPSLSLRKYEKQDLITLRGEVREMFEHAYSSYLKYAYPYDELRPLTCDGIDTWGSYSLTLIDALDTLAVMGNYTEFQRVIEIVTANANFDANINVSVFETNIRIVGGLLSAHLLSQRAGVHLEPGWPCNGPLLRLAEDVAQRLLPAFDTITGMPYGTVNLKYGVPPGETPVTCTAGVGTFILEFGTLSRLTGDPVYEEVALNALNSLYQHRSPIGLFGNHIDVMTGRWTAQDSGIGAGVDSYFEYLVKGSLLLQRPELMAMFSHIRQPIDKYLKKNNWYVWASMHKGQVTLPVFQSLEAYWPGVLTLIGDVEKALRSMHNYNSIWKQYGFTPEFYNIAQGEAGTNRESYPLRPELAESAMYLHRATGDPFMLDIGLNILRSIQHSAKTPCGYATIKDTRYHTQENRMESFFLAETTKYLYLLFDPDNFIHNKGQYGHIHTLASGRQCVLDSGGYIFNTEAHPIDPGALQCCYDTHTEEMNKHFNAHHFRGESLKNMVEDKNVAEMKVEPIKLGQFKVEEMKVEKEYTEKPKPVILETVMGAELSSALPETEPELSTVQSNKKEDVIETKKDVEMQQESLKTSPILSEVDESDLKSKLAKNKETLNQILNIVKSRKQLISTFNDQKNPEMETLSKKYDEVKSDILGIMDKQIGFLDNVLKDEVDMNKENEPTFHQEYEGRTTENTSKEPVMSEGDWNSENLSYQIDDENSGGQAGGGERGDASPSSLPQFVKQLVLPAQGIPEFDSQQLLEKIRAKSKYFKTKGWSTQYELLSCKAQPFSIRVTMTGEFLDDE